MSAPQSPPQDWQRMLAAADFSRALAERDDAHRRQSRELLLAFLDVLDAVERLAAHGGGATAANLAALDRQLRDAFGRAGVRFFASLHQPFDPERHQAVETRPHPTFAPGTILEEVRAGCEWQGELLRTTQAVVVRPTRATPTKRKPNHG